MTDGEMTWIAEILRRQLYMAVPERYTVTRAFVYDIYAEFSLKFSDTDPDFLPVGFHALIFEDYPPDLYG